MKDSTAANEFRRGSAKLFLPITLDPAPDEYDPRVKTLVECVSINGTLRRTLLIIPNGPEVSHPAVLIIGGIGSHPTENRSLRSVPEGPRSVRPIGTYVSRASEAAQGNRGTQRVFLSGVTMGSYISCDSVPLEAYHDVLIQTNYAVPSQAIPAEQEQAICAMIEVNRFSRPNQKSQTWATSGPQLNVNRG